MGKTGFLLGAGFSKALHSKMPVMSELLGQLNSRAKIPQYVPEPVCSDLELTLSYLWTNYPWHSETHILRNRIDYIELVRALHEILSNTEFSVWHEIFRESGFLNRQDWRYKLAWILAQNDRSVVLTMNYDTLLERLMIISNNDNWLWYPAPIQRLHGALNQQRESTTHISSIEHALFSPALYKLHGSLSWYSLNGIDENSIVYGLDMDQYYVRPNGPIPSDFSGSLFPVIIPPVADKATLYSNKVLRSQWMGALDGLKECETLFCVGYSFPKSDLAMQMFMSEASSNIRELYIVNRRIDHDIENRIRNVLHGKLAVQWIYGENCVEEMLTQLIDRGMYHGENYVESFSMQPKIT